jgi:hypothetical protein
MKPRNQRHRTNRVLLAGSDISPASKSACPKRWDRAVSILRNSAKNASVRASSRPTACKRRISLPSALGQPFTCGGSTFESSQVSISSTMSGCASRLSVSLSDGGPALDPLGNALHRRAFTSPSVRRNPSGVRCRRCQTETPETASHTLVEICKPGDRASDDRKTGSIDWDIR